MIEQNLPMQQQASPQPPAVQQQPPGQQAMPQPQPGGQQAPPQGGNKAPYPADKGEAKQFSNDLLQVLYDERTHGNIVKQLSDVQGVAIGKGVGLISGHIVGNRLADVRGQTGRKIEMRLVADATKAVVSELAEIAEGEELFVMAPEDKKEAFMSAIDVLDRLERKGGQQ